MNRISFIPERPSRILAGVAFLSALLCRVGPAWAKLKTETVEYKHGQTVCEGFLAYDDEWKEKRPGVIVVHEWKGLGDYARKRAQQLVSLGYVGFAIDMYGKGVRAKDHEEAAKLAGVYRNDRGLMRARAAAGLQTLKRHAAVEPSRLAAIGYCFGGTTALEMARSGADLKGVVSFHGSLGTPRPEETRGLAAKVLVQHGGDDAFVPKEELMAFMEEMRRAGADWQVNVYSKAVHSFTVDEAGSDPAKGMAYNAAADRRSWEAMKDFLAEVFE